MSVTLNIEELKKVVSESVESQLKPLRDELDTLNTKINKDIRINYLSTMARARERESEQLVKNFECSYDVTSGVKCKSDIKSQMTNYTQSLAVGDIANSMTIITELHNKAKKNAFDSNRSSQCNRDWKEVSKIVSRHKDMIKDLSSTITSNKVPSDIGELDFDPEDLFKNVIFPFSHILRLQIIYTLKGGSKRFTSLKNDLGVKNTGLLVHHLKPLTVANLVTQDHRKQYTLTDKGYLVVRYLSQLSTALNPKEEIISMIQPLVVLNSD